MTKYSDSRRVSAKKKYVIHPIWRGIGFIFMTLTPILAFYFTDLLLTLNAMENWFPIQKSLLANGSDPYLYLKIGGTILIVFFVYIIFMLITFLIYQFFGPSQLGPMDAPQTDFSGKPRRR